MEFHIKFSLETKKACFNILVHIPHKMIVEDEYFDLCGLLKDQLMENVKLTKDMDYSFRFGTLSICIMMYFLNCLP